MNVGKPLATKISSLNTKELTLEKDLISALNVENSLGTTLDLWYSREFTWV